MSTSESQPSSVLSQIPLNQIRTSPFNYRRTVHCIAELAKSIAADGVQQPIKVRPVPPDEAGRSYEIVFGERRYRAAGEAGLSAIPAFVEDLPDGEVQRLQVLENSQRADVHPLEEAEGWERLLKLAGPSGPLYTVESLAQLVGRSAQHVYGRLKLTSLIEPARKAFYEGALTPTTALLVARVPAALQPKVLERALRPNHMNELPSARELFSFIQASCMLRLDGAPFPTADKELLPAAGACAECPKRTGNSKLLFADIQADDVCTDPDCFRAKADARWQRALADAQELGRSVLDDKEASRIFSGCHVIPGSGYVDLRDRCSFDKKNRTWRKLLAKEEPAITIARDSEGFLHELVARRDACAILTKLGLLDPKDTKDTTPPQRFDGRAAAEGAKAAAAKTREESFVRSRVIHGAMASIVAKVERKQPEKAFWSLWLQGILHGSWHDSIRAVCKRRGIDYDQKRSPAEVLEAAAKKMTADELRGLALELTLSRGLYTFFPGQATDFGPMFKAACEQFGVDVPELRKEAKSALAAKTAARKAKASSSAPRKAA